MKTRQAISCCGRKREALRSGGGTPELPPLPPHGEGRIQARFRYVGETGLTIHGPVSGMTYRFPSPNTELEVDGRDAFGFATVPVLERVR